MKVIHITTVPFTLRFHRGHIRFSKSKGVEIHAISSPGDALGSLDEVGRHEGISVHPVSMERRISPVKDVVSLWHLWRILMREQPDIVHSHTPKAALLGAVAARAAGVKVVLLSIFGVRQITMTGFPRRLLDFTTWLSCKLADRIWCDSPSIRDFIVAERLCGSKKIIVLCAGSVAGVDARKAFSPYEWGIAARQAVREENGIPHDAQVVGFVGRIVADKGMRELASAWRRLRDRYPMLHLVLVGPFDATDPVSAEDEALFRTDGRVHLTGLREDVARYLAGMDVFVLPSYREGFPVVNLEAAAMALPVVSTRIPGCVDSVRDGVTGTLVPPRHATALADAITAYLDDPILRRQHGQAGRERVLQEFRPEDVWESLYRLYLDLTNGEQTVRVATGDLGARATAHGSGRPNR
ncbi:MAG: glycosyltransferase family 4 protein [Phycisphaerae bacterium]|nr:glycosyltransferase family 4 protein [Phycisphaerae bacterium]